MLTPDAISALLRAGEGEALEFNERFGPDVIQTAVAFANTHGGTVLIERYGGGIERIQTACAGAGLPPPALKNFQGGFRMVFKQAEDGRQAADQVPSEVQRVLLLLQGEVTRPELMQKLGLKDEKHLRQSYQQAAIALGVVEMTPPEKPRSRLQKYRLTTAGRGLKRHCSLATARKTQGRAKSHGHLSELARTR